MKLSLTYSYKKGKVVNKFIAVCAVILGFLYKSPGMENREPHFQDIHIGIGRAFPGLESETEKRSKSAVRI